MGAERARGMGGEGGTEREETCGGEESEAGKCVFPTTSYSRSYILEIDMYTTTLRPSRQIAAVERCLHVRLAASWDLLDEIHSSGSCSAEAM